jgi:predicted dehydrogenase
MDAPPLRWGILAPGTIARAFALTVQAHTRQRIVAVGSRSAERAAAFAAQLGIERSYGTYEQLAEDPDVDVVYIASPQSEHLAHALLAIGAGKHVLVEKPFTRSADEAEQLVAAARERGVFLMEAMWMRFLPHIDVVRQVLAAGALGDVHTVFADHGQFLAPEVLPRLHAPELGGGALLDLGVYPVSFASLVLGPFASVTAVGTMAPSGVDGHVSMIVTTERGAHGLLSTTLFAKTPTMASISGTLARLELEGSVAGPVTGFYGPTTVRLIGRDGELLDTFAPARLDDGLAYQAAELARCVTAGRTESDLMPHAETLRVMRTLDAVRAQIGVRPPGE